jgi:nucleoside-diphosphate-sugar epimerase
MMAQLRQVFLTGSTGFLGRSLAAELLRRGHGVRALVRPGSESRVAPGCEVVHGDALRSETYAAKVAPSDTFVHLIGVSHPSPSKAEEFRTIDLVSCQEAVKAAQQSGVRHFVYLSVARPAPMMKEYQAVRAEGERMITDAEIPATFVRPWYVLGPGRSWPIALKPLYALARLYPPTRESALRLALVTLEQMTHTLAWSVENPPERLQVFEPPQIKLGGKFGENPLPTPQSVWREPSL